MADETLRTVARTVALLKAFTPDAPELSAAALMGRLGLPRSVVVRILQTLERSGLVERAPGNPRLFRIGLVACEVGSLYFAGNPLLRSAEAILQDLAERTGFTAYLGTLKGSDVTILASREGRAAIRFIWHAGDRLPVATTALGKAMLMHLNARQVDGILGDGPIAGLSEGSIRTRAELDRQLAEYADKGWVPASEESFPGVFAVGAAVLDPNNVPVAGISLSFLRNSAAPDEISATAVAVLESARAISRRLAPHVAYGRRAFGPVAPLAAVDAAGPRLTAPPHRMQGSC